MTDAARSRRDDPRQEPQLAIPARPAPAPALDPLAELARLVGQDDPFRGVFRPAGSAPSRQIPEARPAAEPWAAERGLHDNDMPFDGDRRGHGEDSYADGHGVHTDECASLPHGDEGYDPYLAEDEQHAAAERAAYPDEAGLADERFAPDYASPDALPDHWASGADGAAPPLDDQVAPVRAAGSGSARRPLMVLAAVLALTGGGLAASFLAKGPSSSGAVSAAGGGRGAPTILAASGPTKVKVDDPAATAPEDQDAALLNKNAGGSSGPVKIVSSQEQPADLGQLPKADLAEGARPLPPAAPSPFPEPKKVKTFVIHPDGTMLSGEPAPGTGQLADAGAASTPRTAARGGATPSAAPAAPASIASLAADPAPAIPAAAPAPAPVKPPRQAASPGARTASAKPNDAAASPASGGSFGLQLASSPVEAEANAAFAKLKKKYPAQLGGFTATVHKAETGDKPVYRVRVGGMSQDEANALCAKLQGAGGSCYVVHN